MRDSAYKYCFGCGEENPRGLNLDIKYDGDKARIEFDIAREYTGYPGLMHGGITGILIDEAMFYAILKLGVETVTTEMTIKYLKPGKEGRHIVCEAWVASRHGRRIDVEALISDDGIPIARGYGKYFVVDIEEMLAKA